MADGDKAAGILGNSLGQLRKLREIDNANQNGSFFTGVQTLSFQIIRYTEATTGIMHMVTVPKKKFSMIVIMYWN